MESKTSRVDLEKLPLIFSMTEISELSGLALEMRKVVPNKKYREAQYPVSSHYKHIIRF